MALLFFALFYWRGSSSQRLKGRAIDYAGRGGQGTDFTDAVGRVGLFNLCGKIRPGTMRPIRGRLWHCSRGRNKAGLGGVVCRQPRENVRQNLSKQTGCAGCLRSLNLEV